MLVPHPFTDRKEMRRFYFLSEHLAFSRATVYPIVEACMTESALLEPVPEDRTSDGIAPEVYASLSR